MLANTHHDAEIFALAFNKEKHDPDLVRTFWSKHGITNLQVSYGFLDSFFKDSSEVDLTAIKKFLAENTSGLFRDDDTAILSIK